MKRSALGLIGVLLALASCSLGPREGWAEAIRGAQGVAVREGTAKVQVHIAVDVIESVARSRPQPVAKRLAGVVDFANRRSRIVSESVPKVDLRSDDFVSALPRTSAEGDEERWIRIDFTEEPEVELDVQDRRFAVAFPVVTPQLAVELLQGVLTGSIEDEGRDRVLGAATTRYSARMAPDSALREIEDEDRREAVARVLETMGVAAEVLDVQVWLDDEGRPRRVRYEFEQRQDRVNVFRFTYRVDFSAFGVPVEVEMPDDVVRTDDFQQFVTEFVRERIAV